MNRPAEAGADPFATFAAAYVIGALSPQDRADFEEHLGHCDECSRSVRELAGLPGLMAQVGPEQLEPHRFGSERPPSTLLAKLLRQVRRVRRRRVIAGIAAAVATAAACVALVLALIVPGPQATLPGSEMTPLGPYPVRATVSLTEAPWGMRVDMSCTYQGGKNSDYQLVAVQPNGTVSELASWYAVPQDTAHLSVGTPLHRPDIAALEIRMPGGHAVLRLPVSG